MSWGALLSALRGEHYQAEQVLLDAIDLNPRNHNAVNLLSYVLRAAGKEYDGFEAYLSRQEARATEESAAALALFEQARQSGIAKVIAAAWRGYRVRDAVKRLVLTVEEQGLAEEWDKLYTGEGQEYFHNTRTGVTSWSVPAVWRMWEALRMMGVVTGNGAVTGGGRECAGVWRGKTPRPPPGGAFAPNGEFHLARLRFEDEEDEGCDVSDSGGSSDRAKEGTVFSGGAESAGGGGGGGSRSRSWRGYYTKESAFLAPSSASGGVEGSGEASSEGKSMHMGEREHDPMLWEFIRSGGASSSSSM